jgi:hypothetical protein
MVSDRMKNALDLADKCWNKANSEAPEFVEAYLEHAEKLLLSKPYVRGEEFRAFCHQNGLARPKHIHPNVWVSGVRALSIIGWINPVKKVVPETSHNHMPSVTLWQSRIYK